MLMTCSKKSLLTIIHRTSTFHLLTLGSDVARISFSSIGALERNENAVYIYIYIYIYVLVCVCVCEYVWESV